MKKTIAILMFITIISKISGFGRDITLSYFYGASYISDAYIISLTIPTAIFAVIGKGISTGFVPMFTRIENGAGRMKAQEFTNQMVNAILLLCLLIFFFGFLYAEEIVDVFAGGFDGKTAALAVSMTRISLLAVFFTGLNYVFFAYLQVREMFVAAALMGLPMNIVFISFIIISSHTHVFLLSVGNVAAFLATFIMLIAFSYKKKYRYRRHLNMRNPNMKKMQKLMFPAMFGSSIAQINLLVDRTLASHLIQGGISALNYASTLSLVVVGLIGSSISTIMYPKISKMAANNEIDAIKKSITDTVVLISLIVLPATCGFLFLSTPIVDFLYGRGQFDLQAIQLTAAALYFYAFGLAGMCLMAFFSDIFYSFQNTKTPMFISAGIMAVNIILNFTLAPLLGIGGLALATSISQTLGTFILLSALQKRLGKLDLKPLLKPFIKILFASIGTAFIARASYSILNTMLPLSIALTISILTAIAVYFLSISFMRIEQFRLVPALISMKKGTGHYKRIHKVE